MKRLSEFKDDAGMELVADLIPHIGNIVKNPGVRAARDGGGSVMDFVAAMLKHCKGDVKGILALLNETPTEEYEYTAASLLADTFTLVTDPSLLSLFGLQSQTPTSSGSASESTEVRDQ